MFTVEDVLDALSFVMWEQELDAALRSPFAPSWALLTIALSEGVVAE